jgi:predicted Fe-Mo cluster-binding NifX family protein
MRIAVAASERHAEAEISERTGRAPFLLIFDESGTLQESLANPYAMAERGAGRKLARLLAQQRIDLLIGGRFGPALTEELAALGVRGVEDGGPARPAVLSAVR